MAATAYELLAFVLFAGLTLGASVGVVLVRDVWHAALLLGVALLSVAIHFVMLRAEFLAAMQILVYVGGVLILISFAIMLIRREIDPAMETRPEFDVGPGLVRGAGAVAVFALLGLVTLVATFDSPAGFPGEGSITASIGYALIGLEHLSAYPVESFLVALIVLAVVLDAAIDGSIMLARRDERGDPGTAVSDGGRAVAEPPEEE